MKNIVLALALLLFTSPVHAGSINGKVLECNSTKKREIGPSFGNLTEVMRSFWGILMRNHLKLQVTKLKEFILRQKAKSNGKLFIPMNG